MSQSCIFYLENTAARFPEKTAIIDKEKSYTFAELREKARALAQAIPTALKNRPIAVHLDKGVDSIVAFAAVLYSGNFYVPLDSASPPERLKKVLTNLSPAVIIAAKGHRKFLASCCAGEQILLVDALPEFPPPGVTQKFFLEGRAGAIIDTDPIYCMYTSGSTGDPKGVLIPHRAVRDYIEWVEHCYRVNEAEVIASQSPFHFDNSVLDIYVMMKTGATLHILPEEHFSFPSLVIDYLERNEVSLIFWVPSALIRIANLGLLEGRALSALKKVLFCGEVMPCKFLNYWVKMLPNTEFSNLYGPTEITDVCTYFIVDRLFEDDDVLPLGFACANTEILVLNSQDQLVEENEIGELCVRGSSLALGYWNDAEKTRLSFPQNPLNRNYPERIYRTGDLAKYNERGELMFCGRKDSQIKLSGFRIELGEIENAVTALPDIRNSLVLFNEPEAQITLFYASNRDDFGPEQIRQMLRLSLPKYMVPSKFYRLTELPLTSNGKIDRVTLARDYLTD